MYDLALAIAASILIGSTESMAYTFECGYYIDGILIHEATPRYNQTWYGFAVYDRIIIKAGLTPEERMMVFAHERKHYERMRNGSFNRYDLEEEERIAYLYGWNESNWDNRINRFHCVEE